MKYGIAKLAFKKKRAASTRPPAPSSSTSEAALAEWVPQVLEKLGISEDLLYDEEPPEELLQLLPLAKGFLEEKIGKKKTDEDGDLNEYI